jgi:hypothetical protein
VPPLGWTRFRLKGESNEVLPGVLSLRALRPHDSGPTMAGVGPKRNLA